MTPKKLILWTFLAFVALAMLAGIAAVVLPRGWVNDDVMITILIVGAYSLGGLIVVILGGIKGSGGRLQRWTLRMSSGALLISMALFITGIWVGWRYDQNFLRPGAVSLSFGLTFVHRLIVCPLSCTLPVFRPCKGIALTTGAITGFIVCAAFITDGFGFYDELMFRILAIAAIICAGTTIATGALAFFAPKPGENEQGTLAPSIPINITCPRCSSTISAQSNKDSRCPTCKLHVRIEVEEPRCTCGYLLYQLQSDSCPECGKPIPTTEQWGSPLSPPPS